MNKNGAAQHQHVVSLFNKLLYTQQDVAQPYKYLIISECYISKIQKDSLSGCFNNMINSDDESLERFHI